MAVQAMARGLFRTVGVGDGGDSGRGRLFIKQDNCRLALALLPKEQTLELDELLSDALICD